MHGQYSCMINGSLRDMQIFIECGHAVQAILNSLSDKGQGVSELKVLKSSLSKIPVVYPDYIYA